MVTELIKPQYGVVVRVKDSEVLYNVTEFFNTKSLVDWFKDTDYKNVIITTRTDAEINHPKWCPHFNVIENLKNKLPQRVCQFIQDPWPEPLINIDIDDETFVLRFAYDEGDEMDKTFRKWDMDDGLYLITNEEVVLL
jgi:hypothetical protein|tara:strand:+ start:1226 stop:1639 length:414 start_codon:yes stop_codon:yes gene_type:complete